MKSRRFAYWGVGIMGAGIAYVAAEAGYEVIMRDVEDQLVAQGMWGIG